MDFDYDHVMVLWQLPLFFFYWYGDRRDLHSFPTRRSSDLHELHEGRRAGNVGIPARDTGHSGTVIDLGGRDAGAVRSEEHTSELQSQFHLVCRLLLEKKKE